MERTVEAGGTGRRPSAATSAWALLVVLTLLNVLNFLDRQLLAAVAPRLVAELGLTNTQLGLLVGFAFVLFFSFATLALGTFADRVSRTRVVAAGVVLWTAMTAATGAARGFADLAVARLLVGLGEAALVPSALSLLADRFPASRLGLACGIFWAGYPVGRALSYLVAGVVAPHVGWRSCFFALGGIGFLGAAALFAFGDTSGRRAAAPPGDGSTVGEPGRAFTGSPALRWVVAGNVLAAFAASASQLDIAWLVAERGLAPGRAALAGAVVVATAGAVANPLVGALADRWERARPGGRLLCLATVMGATMPVAAAFYWLPPGVPSFYGCWLVAQLGLIGWQGVSSAAIQELTPPGRRALTVAQALVVINLLGIGPGASLTGAIGDARSLTAGLIAAAGIGLAGVVPYLLAARRFAADRERVMAEGSLGSPLVRFQEDV
jgi:MFS family permease